MCFMKHSVIKNGFSMFLASLVALGSIGASAAELNDAKIDVASGMVEISGKVDESGKDIALIVLNPGGTLENIQTNEGYLQHQWSVKSGEDGAFTYSFKLNLDGKNDSGDYRIYIGGKTVGTPIYTDFYYASEGDVKEVIDGIRKPDPEIGILGVISKEENAKKLFVDTFEPFKMGDKAEIAKILEENIKAATDENGNVPEYTAASMQTMIFEASIVAAFNTSKKDLVLKDGEFLYEDILKTATLDEDLNVSLLEIYNTSMTDAGKELVRDAMFGKGYKTIEEIKKAFASEILLKGITNSKKNGFEHVKKILTDENIKFANLVITKTLTDDNLIALASESGYESLLKLQEKIDSFNEITSDSPSYSESKGPSGGSISLGVVVTQKPETVKKNEFSDIYNYSWAEEAIYDLRERGIISGVTEDRFAPEAELTREQAVKILCISAGIDAKNEPTGFSDVDENAWYAGYVKAAKDAGVVSGISESQFGVGKKITRQDFAVMIQRVFELKGSSETASFNDYESVSDYAKDAVKILSENGIISGYTGGYFKPFNNCQRAEAAVIIHRVLGGNR